VSQVVNVNERLAALTAAGTSVWLDQIRRSLTQGGELRRLVEEDSLRGVTSNPAIFEKAILGSPDYDEQIEELARGGALARAIYQEIAIQDVQEAADVLRPVFDELDGADGYVSLEVDPDLAFDTDRTIAQAREYWERVGRPNVMIKIPGTTECLPAIEEAIYEGINVNVTLLFAVEAYATVAEAFIRGLERRQAEGKDLDVHSVASFFVSRVDSEVDKRLEALGHSELQGRAAVANARAAYHRFEEIFRGERFAALRAAGAAVQQPLWASTGVKNPAYPETKYVEELVGADTVNTMPMQTLLACAERLEVHGETVREDPAPVLTALAEAGIDMDEVTDKLLQDGIDAFVTPMEKLLAGIEAKREAIFTGRPETIDSSLPDELEPLIAELVKRAEAERVARRIWAKDDTLWGPAGQPEVANRLGWLTAHEMYGEEIDDLESFAEEAVRDGFTDAVLLGMGGSSLAPEVLRRSFGGRQHGRLRLHVLDSTDPGAILAQQRAVDLETTIFIVSTKSGGTIETISLLQHFWSERPVGAQYVAITDPGSSLEALAAERGFRRTFLNDPDVGGRYSALTYFGLVPAALMGVDLDSLLEGAGVAAEACTAYSSEGNSGLWLGISLAALALQGRDKLTLIVDDPVASFGLWAEQLVAESLGKQGKGIVPVTDEPVGAPGAYGRDRVFSYLRDSGEPSEQLDDAVRALAADNQPTVTLSAGGAEDLGRIFFFAEFATAVAGWALQINPFDQPDVQVAKDTTGRILGEIAAGGDPPSPASATDDELRALLADAGPPAYVALLGFMAPSEAVDEAVAELRATIRAATAGTTTTFGYGPRYLHSTGQLHKGGPSDGRFLVLVHDGAEDVEIPGRPFGFRALKNAQAAGDLETLRSRGRRAEFVRLEGDDIAGAVRALTARVEGLIA
jgi:transaldolase/glucose-6-phosphate isomerase